MSLTRWSDDDVGRHQRRLRPRGGTISRFARSVLLALLVAVPAIGDDLYVVRSHDAQNPATLNAEGVWRVSADGLSYQRLHALFYNQRTGSAGAALAAAHDRLFLQGPAYVEFDSRTGRVLRRYSAIGSQWSFQGMLVSAEDAVPGVPPGIYGYPICTPLGEGSGGCGIIQPPGYAAPIANRTDFALLYRRSLDPADTQLTLVKHFPSIIDGVQVTRRQLTLDRRRNIFWTWTEGQGSTNSEDRIERLAQLPATTHGLQDEHVTYERTKNVILDPPNVFRTSLAFAHEPSIDGFYQTVRHDSSAQNDYRFLRRDVASLTEITLDQTPPDGTITVPIAIAAATARAPATYHQVVPVIGAALGVNGTRWASDLWLYNPSDARIKVQMRRITTGATTEYTLLSHGTLKIPDVLRALGGGPLAMGGDGVPVDALAVTSPYQEGAQLAVYSRTYTNAPRGGTRGQGVPGVPTAVGYSTHLPTFGPIDGIDDSTPATFILDKRDPAQFRHNLGVVNDTDQPITLRLRYGSSAITDGELAGVDQRIVVPPHSVGMRTIEVLFAGDIIRTLPPRLWVVADHPAPIWLSMVDNQSGDATFLPYALFAFRGDESRLAIPFIPARQPADFLGYLPRAATAPVPARWHSAGTCEHTHTDGVLQGAVGNTTSAAAYYTIYPDLAAQLQPCVNATLPLGTLELNVASWMTGFVRVTTGAANEATSDVLPFYPLDGWPSQHFPAELQPGVSAHIRAYNGTESTAEYRVSTFSAAGSLLHDAQYRIDAHQTIEFSLRDAVHEDGLYGVSIRAVCTASTVCETVPGTWSAVITTDESGDRTTWW